MSWVQGLSFVDGVAWWADGKSEKEVAEELGRAATAALEWSQDNGITFDRAKTEAMFLPKRRRKSTETVRVGTTRSPSTTGHAVATSLDRLQDGPQRAPLCEDETGSGA